MDGRDDVPGLADIKVAKLQKEVDSLATEITITGFMEHEAERVGTCVCYYLRRIFAARQGIEIPKIWWSAIGHNIADNVDNGTTSIVVKFKKSHGGFSEVPRVEVVGHVAHLNAKSMKKHIYNGGCLAWV